MPSVSPTHCLTFLLSPEIISFPPFQIVNFYYLLFASDLCSNLLHDPALLLQPSAVLPPPQCPPFSYVMKCTALAFLFFFFLNKLKPSLSYPWPDVLLWLMTHVLVSSLTEIMECVTAVLGWLVPALAASPACHPRGSCQHLCSPPAFHTHRQLCTPPHLAATCCRTFFLLRFCPPPYLCDDKMGLGGPLTGQPVPEPSSAQLSSDSS